MYLNMGELLFLEDSTGSTPCCKTDTNGSDNVTANMVSKLSCNLGIGYYGESFLHTGQPPPLKY